MGWYKNGINIIDKDFKIAYSQTKIYENKLFIYDIGSNSLGKCGFLQKKELLYVTLIMLNQCKLLFYQVMV